MSDSGMKAALAEFIATLLFVFLGPATVVVTGMIEGGQMTAARLVAIAVAHGLAIMLLVSATAPISGGHINPAVTIGALVAGKIDVNKAIMYIVAQLLGAVVGSAILAAVVPGGVSTGLGAHGLGAGVSVGQGILAEIMLTFTLVFVVFSTAVDPKGLGTIAPIAIGFAVLVDHLVGVPLTGASMNPARSFGPWVITGFMDVGTHFLVYWIGPIVGGALAALVYQNVFMEREA